jgi:hypothetical protein
LQVFLFVPFSQLFTLPNVRVVLYTFKLPFFGPSELDDADHAVNALSLPACPLLTAAQ